MPPFERRAQEAEGLRELLENFESWCTQGRQSVYWAFYKTVETKYHGAIRIEELQCVLCQRRPARSSGRAYGKFTYNSHNGTTNLVRHVRASHPQLVSALEKELDCQGRLKKRKSRGASSSTEVVQERRAHEDKYDDSKPKQARFTDDLVLLVTKGLLPFSIVEKPEFRRLVENLDPKIRHVSRRELVDIHVPTFVEKMRGEYIQPCLENCIGGSLQFDLWMSKKTRDVFSMVFTLIDERWTLHHVNLGVIDSERSDGASLATDILCMLHENELQNRVVALVKDQGSNLRSATSILREKISKNPISQLPFLNADCYAHALNKVRILSGLLMSLSTRAQVCKNAMVCAPEIKTAMKEIASIVQYTKKSAKGARLLSEAQDESGLPRKKLVGHVATRFASYLACFESVLANEKAIKLMFSTTVPENHRQRLPSAFSWSLIKIVNNALQKVVSLLFQSQGNLLISDVVMGLLELYSDVQNAGVVPEEIMSSIQHQFDDDYGNMDSDFERFHDVAKGIAVSVCGTLEEFLMPFNEFVEEKCHVYMCLQLDPRFKKLRYLREMEQMFPSFFRVRALNKNYEDTLYRCALNVYRSVHYKDDDDANEDTQSAVSVGSLTEFSEHEEPHTMDEDDLLIVRKEFRNYRSDEDVPREGSPLEWWRTNHVKYPNLAVLARQFLSIPSSQSECERTFSVAGLLTQNRRSNMSIEHLDLVIKINKNIENFDSFKASGTTAMMDFIDRERELLEGDGGFDDDSNCTDEG